MHLKSIKIGVIFTAARQTLAKAWKSEVLTITQVKHKISWYLFDKKLTAILHDKLK